MQANIQSSEVQSQRLRAVCGERTGLAPSRCLIKDCQADTAGTMLCDTHKRVFQSHGIPKVRCEDDEQ